MYCINCDLTIVFVVVTIVKFYLYSYGNIVRTGMSKTTKKKLKTFQ